MMKKLLSILILLPVLLSCSFAYGQIKAPTADRVDSTAYVNDSILGTDPIYVFYTPNKNGHDVGGDLTASLNDTIYANYRWYLYSELSNDFIFVDHEDDSVNTSTYNQETFEEGLYRVQITDTIHSIDTSWYAWVSLNTFDLTVPLINSTKTNCLTMGLNSSLTFDKLFTYFDLLEPDSVLFIENDIDSLYWTTTERYPYTLPDTLNPVFKAPTLPTKFTIKVQDIFGYTVEKYIDITEDEPLQNGYPWLRAVKADFEASRYFSPEGENDSTGQAPMNVQFENNSENAQTNQWTFYNYEIINADENRPDTVKLFIEDAERPEDSILYDYPGEYSVKLMVEGPEYKTITGLARCPDVRYIPLHIKVDTVFMPTLMNVFTPNKDNMNDRFYFENYPGEGSSGDFNEPKSIKEFSIKIYSRWGGKLHDFSGKIEDWEGWDGETPGIGTAKTGVYYYHAIFTGYDNVVYEDRKGFVHVFR